MSVTPRQASSAAGSAFSMGDANMLPSSAAARQTRSAMRAAGLPKRLACSAMALLAACACRPASGLQLSLQRDGGVQQARNRAIFLSVGSDVVELRLIDSRHLGIELQIRFGNRPVSLHLFQRDGGLRRQFFGLEAGAIECGR